MWKVGDKLRWLDNPVYPFNWVKGRDKDTIVEILSIAGSKYTLSDGSKWDESTQWGHLNQFWTLVGAPPYQNGDRVQRTDIDNGVIKAGSWGTVTEVATDQICVLWDAPYDALGNYPYSWPQRAAYISPGQVEKRVLRCERCGEPNEYAVVNTSVGTYRCFQCRKDRFR